MDSSSTRLGQLRLSDNPEMQHRLDFLSRHASDSAVESSKAPRAHRPRPVGGRRQHTDSCLTPLTDSGPFKEKMNSFILKPDHSTPNLSEGNRTNIALAAPYSPTMKRRATEGDVPHAFSFSSNSTSNSTPSSNSSSNGPIESVQKMLLCVPGLEELPFDDFVPPEQLLLDPMDVTRGSYELGQGGQARIFRAFIGDELVAVKMSDCEDILFEYVLISKFDHAAILKPVAFSVLLEEDSATPSAATTSVGGETEQDGSDDCRLSRSTPDSTSITYFACYEYASQGDLANFLQRHPSRRTDQHFLTRTCLTILSGLEYLHSNGYVHCDIKPENILVMADRSVKIADFGMSQKIGNNMRPQGTPSYLAPEIIETWFSTTSTNSYTSALDIFSFGVTLLHIITKKYPFRRITQTLHSPGQFPYTKEEIMKMYRSPRRLLQEAEILVPATAALIKDCLNFDPTQRPSAKELLQTMYVISAGGMAAISTEPRFHSLSPQI